MVAHLLIPAPLVHSLRAEAVPEGSVSPTMLGTEPGTFTGTPQMFGDRGIMKERQGECH